MKKRWHIRQPDPHSVRRLSTRLNCHPITAAVLLNRHIQSEKEVADFIEASLGRIRSPFTLQDMPSAVQRIAAAIDAKENILIFGDYDADGVAATAILLDFFSHLNAPVSAYIPHRIREGYGLQPRHITDYAVAHNIALIITADCGSASSEAVATARQCGIDVIITDHHNISEQIPPATAVINPKRRDCVSGLDTLAGVGVAFCLLICVRTFLRDRQYWSSAPEPNLKKLCDLVALGTIADMAPLVYENRIFTKTGISVINSDQRPGLTALVEAAGISKNSVDADDIAFRLAPRLNAAGRLAHASMALELLTTKDIRHARQIARSLNTLNQNRQDLENQIIDAISRDLAERPHLLQKKSLVLWDPRWHEGVLGIVAARMVERYYRPVVLIATKGQFGKGSARSIPEIDLYDRLSACQSTLQTFGGHSMAAGLSIHVDNLEVFQRRFDEAVNALGNPDSLRPALYIDGELNFADISQRLIDEIESLAPFGSGNPEPVFMARDVRVASSKIVGQNHRRMVLKQAPAASAKGIQAIHFNVDTRLKLDDSFDQIAFRLRWNRWNGMKTAHVVIEDI